MKNIKYLSNPILMNKQNLEKLSKAKLIEMLNQQKPKKVICRGIWINLSTRG